MQSHILSSMYVFELHTRGAYCKMHLQHPARTPDETCARPQAPLPHSVHQPRTTAALVSCHHHHPRRLLLWLPLPCSLRSF